MMRRFVFLGVTTARSSIVAVFPRWRDFLGLGADVELIGWDLPIHAPPEHYRAAITSIRDDEGAVGALITTHKIDLFAAAADLFDEVDPYARLLCETSCITKHAGGMQALATDPISSGRALAAFLEPGHFRGSEAGVLCLGAGGAGRAILVHLLHALPPDDRPRSVLVSDVSADRLDGARAVGERIRADAVIDYVQVKGAADNDALLRNLPPRSLVINATGLGKDVPGSPLSPAARFPRDAVVWDLNYRGDLTFLRQAREQQSERGLRIEDGWEYFIHGWATIIERVFDRRIVPSELERMKDLAASARPTKRP